MIYPKNFEEKIGFNQVRELLIQACSGAPGRAFAEKMRFSSNFDNLNKLLDQTEEFRQIVLSHPNFPSDNYFNILPLLRKAEIEGTYLEEDEFHTLKLSLQTVFRIVKFLVSKEGEPFSNLRGLNNMVAEADKNLPNRIEHVIDHNGHVRDSASTELQRIRRSIISAQSGLRRRIDSIMREAKANKLVAEDAELTVRSGRIVIPVPAENKRMLKGFIHDESATGQTAFIEPAEIFETNNIIRELEYEERREVIRILMQLTGVLRPQVPVLMSAANYLGLMDFIRAKARLALAMDAVKPEFKRVQGFTWMKARHPLLEMSLARQNRKVVPLDIALSPEQRIIVISGPNAGGKSVTLKTVGLLQYMLQCGMLIPVAPHSESGIFEDVLLDMGDEQSLENDLSTYSSHLSNMKHFIKYGGRKSLFLIDEFGTGTEPRFGGAIAEAILTQLNDEKMFGVVTTHYGNLKSFADKTTGISNAAMRFNMTALEPLYQLETGKPGSSFALEIAEKIGLPVALLDKARNLIGEKHVKLDSLIKELEIEKTVFSERNMEMQVKERQLTKTLSDYTELKATLDAQQKLALNQAKAQAKKLLEGTNRLIEQTIRDIKENKAEKEPTRQIRQKLEDFKKTLEPEIVPHIPEPKAAGAKNTVIEVPEADLPIGVGSFVRLKDTGNIAEVTNMDGKDVEIRIGQLKSHVKFSRLERVSRKEYMERSAEEVNRPGMGGIDLHERATNFSFNLDLRGKRAEECVPALHNFMDDAVMLGVPELRIVHGKGDGILRQIVRNVLAGMKGVGTVKDEHADRGGAGVTVVTMR